MLLTVKALVLCAARKVNRSGTTAVSWCISPFHGRAQIREYSPFSRLHCEVVGAVSNRLKSVLGCSILLSRSLVLSALCLDIFSIEVRFVDGVYRWRGVGAICDCIHEVSYGLSNSDILGFNKQLR